MTSDRTWDVLLLGGASGAGKTHVSYRLAHHYGVGITEVDDFQNILQLMTTPEQFPALHFWPTHPDPMRLSPEEIVANGIEICRGMSRPLEVVIADHLSEGTPLVYEGDFIDPELASRERFLDVPNEGRVRAIVIDESDEDQFVENFHEREGTEQRKRAQVSVLFASWLRARAAEHGAVVVPARPWDTVFERAVRALTT